MLDGDFCESEFLMSNLINRTDHHLGQQVYFYRHKLQWPLKILAQRLNISLQQLQRYEQGINKIPASLLVDIAQVMDIPIHHFFETPRHELHESSKHHYVMLVEDDPQEAFFIQKALKDYDKPLEMFTLPSEKKALEFLRDILNEHPTSLPKPHLILLDFHETNPLKLDIDVLRFVKHHQSLQHIPVIILAHQLQPQTIQMLYTNYANGVVSKSFCFKSLEKKLHQIMDYWTKSVLCVEE